MSLPEGCYVEIGGDLRVHYHDLGEGPAVLFLHGSGPGASGHSNFKLNYPAIARAGFRCIVPDTLGFGFSSMPTDAHYTLEFMVDGAKRLIDALGIDRLAVVGNSMGGAMSIRLALDWPERVTRLVLMAPGGLEDRETYLAMRGIKRMVKALFGGGGLDRKSLRRVFELQLYDPSEITEETLDERLQIAAEQPREVVSTMRIPNQTDRLAELRCPVLGFWGTDDHFCPVSGAMKLAERVPDCRVTLLSRCGHWVMVEHPELFNARTIEFLDAP